MAVINREEVLERLGGDGELFDEICDLFLRDGLMMFDRLRVELASGMLDIATRYAHSIKSMASNIGADELTELARKVEMAGRAGDAAGVSNYMPQLESLIQLVLKELKDMRNTPA